MELPNKKKRNYFSYSKKSLLNFRLMIFILQLSFYLNIQLTNQIIKGGGGDKGKAQKGQRGN